MNMENKTIFGYAQGVPKPCSIVLLIAWLIDDLLTSLLNDLLIYLLTDLLND